VDSFLWAIRIAAILVISWGLIGSITKFMAGEGLTAAQWTDLLVAGLSQGAMYGLLALGYSMVYGVLGFINFAHGEVFMSGAMVGFIAANWLFENGTWAANPFFALLVVLVVAMGTSTLVAVLVERIAYRRLRGSPRLIPLITSIGVSFFLQYTFAGLFGVGIRTKLVSLGNQLIVEFAVIFNDSIVDNRYSITGTHMWMGIQICRRSVRGPSRMADGCALPRA